MASSTLQKFLRCQTRPASKILFHLRKPLAPLPHTEISQISDPVDLISKSLETGCLKPNHSSIAHFYPGFSFGFFLNPNSASSLIRPEPDGEATEDDSNVIRADSVKKKRKKKMNKHKLKKLRKRLRRKT